LLFSVKIRKGINVEVTLKSVIGDGKPDAWVTINGAPFALAVIGSVKGLRPWEVAGDKNGARVHKMEEVFAISSKKPILCMVNGRAYDTTDDPWAAFEIEGYVAITGVETETHIGPWEIHAGTFFCAHFKGPQCVYKLGKLLGTNIITNEWQPKLPTPADMYRTKIKKVIPSVSMKIFKESVMFSQRELNEYVDTVKAERKGECKQCAKVKTEGLQTY
jgi:hypothetical protein